ncbi:chalcone-flavanone isomerase-domain-containing protein [Ephemerocybe angulata]|uniref:Chalcone-flavanone isomerase-domain-containing protein n=1 Tax=Ephemerocybe angulata TaxID=980116 RepID=A0A8H6IKN7_9AGAR|nr:chalcone-flavanone isomerase-domain-containing protein [Tulosesus angulatus]
MPCRPLSTVSGASASRNWRTLLCATGLGIATVAALSQTVHLDAGVEDSVVDPATSISFPKTLTVPAKTKLPPVSLVGLGVRTVSFLGIKVYTVAFYADLGNPNLKIAKDLNPEDKIQYIVQNTACVVRIVPTRSTGFTHLRDAFMRALQGRLAIAKKAGTITEAEEHAVASPMHKLKSIFPNSPLAKHTPLDIYLAAPVPGQPRALVFRDMGFNRKRLGRDGVCSALL